MIALFTDYADYLGVVVGLILLIVSSLFLPGKIRLHVLTAGLSLIAYRTFQIYSNKKKLAEADIEREELRGIHEELKVRMKGMQDETEDLRERKIEIENELIDLKNQKEALTSSTEEHLNQKKELDQRTEKLLNETPVVVDKRKSQLEALRAISEFNRKISNDN